MDRIDPLTGSAIPFRQAEKKRVDKKKKVSGGFLSTLQESSGAGTVMPDMDLTEADLEALLDEIHSAGENLAEDPGMRNVMQYKKAVQRFLHFVVKNNRQLEHQEGARLSIFKQPKRYTLIAVVDRKLEQLAAGVLQNQADKLEILKRVEEIQGLLVDIAG